MTLELPPVAPRPGTSPPAVQPVSSEDSVLPPPHAAQRGETSVARRRGTDREQEIPASADSVKRPVPQAAPTEEEPMIWEASPSQPMRLAQATQAMASPNPAEATAPADATVGPFEVIDHAGEMAVVLRRSKLLRTRFDIYRTAVVDQQVCDVVQFTPREVSLIGKSQGATHVTFWFEDETRRPLTYLVKVLPDPDVQQRREEQYQVLEQTIAELFPNSKVRLVPVTDKLIVTGQAADAGEAAQILAIIRGNTGYDHNGDLVEGHAVDPMGQEQSQLPTTNIVNMLRIPGVRQVALHVKIAELNRTAARGFGFDVNAEISFDDGRILVDSLLNLTSPGTGSIIGNFDQNKLNFGLEYLEQHKVLRMLSEPTLVTLSGEPASMVAGGEFAVPTTVGVGGASAVTTDFRAFGAIVTFVPYVLERDLIRLEVAPEFSKVNQDLSVNETPGLDTRAVTTVVEMREGQTFAIAGLLDESMNGSNTGKLPFLAQLWGERSMTRSETELVILVTPELVQPMEPEEVPPLPGFDVTEPTNAEFYLMGRLEGRPTQEYRSTVWPNLRRRYSAGGPAMISGPYGHGN